MGDRLTFHGGYRNARGKAFNGKHNQREDFQKSTAGDKNVYMDFAEKVCHGATFSENEKLFYEKMFEPHVKRHNDKAKKNRQYDRLTTVAAYREKHPPEEVLLYIGTENVNPADLMAVFDDFREWYKASCYDKKKGCGVLLLNAAMHLDETTPHIHFRQMYVYHDKDGDFQISQNKALDGLGFQRPDMSKPVGRFNNSKITFTAVCREKLFEIAKNHGVELISEPLPKNEVGLSLKEYVEREQAREQARQEQAEHRKAIVALDMANKKVEGEKHRLQRDIYALQDEKERLESEIESKRQEAYEDARKAGYEDGFQEGVENGAKSTRGRLNAARRDLDTHHEEKALNGADNEFGGGSPKG